MGNSFEGKSNLLAKNWTKINTATYQNIITEEKIDQYKVQYQKEDELIFNHSLLMKRANLSHPNIIKLIYFYQSSEKGLCTDRIYSHQIFIQHQNRQLFLVNLEEDRSMLKECVCCPILNGLAFLCSKYGYFKVRESMIFSLSQSGWQRSGGKKTAKVWINSRLQSSQAQMICSQSQMCESILYVLQRMVEKGFCKQDYIQYCNRIRKVNDLLGYVYKVHNKNYQIEPETRKRVLSSVSSGHPTLLNTIKIHQQSQDTFFIKNNKSYSNIVNDHFSTKALNKTFETERIVPTPIKKIARPQTMLRESLNSIFYKPQQQPNFKVHFSYNDHQNTPKQNKSEGVIITNNKFNQPTPKRHQNVANSQTITHDFPKESPVIFSQSKQIKKLEEIVENEPPNISLGAFLAQANLKKTDQKIITINDGGFQESVQSVFHKDLPANVQLADKIYETYSKEIQGQADKSNKLPEIKFLRASNQQNSHQQSIRSPAEELVVRGLAAQNNKQYLTALEFEDIESTPIHSRDILETPRSKQILEPPKLYHTTLEKEAGYYDTAVNQQSSRSPKYSKLDSNYNKYLDKFNKTVLPKSNSSRNKFAVNLQNQYQYLPVKKTAPKSISCKAQPYYENSLNFEQTYGRNRVKSKTKFSELGMQMSDGLMNKKSKAVNHGQLQSLYNYSQHDQEENKVKMIEKIQNTEKKLRQNRKKLEKIELEKDLEKEKEIIKKEMESLLKNNLMNDETNRIKQKVKHKNATFAELKAEASKILEDLNF